MTISNKVFYLIGIFSGLVLLVGLIGFSFPEFFAPYTPQNSLLLKLCITYFVIKELFSIESIKKSPFFWMGVNHSRRQREKKGYY